ncbi:hypothetical protein ACIRNI_22895 [Streptomyces sp. NPDC093546]|uniref:hypothetical protein n=1 Tax=Streptomyces sp. NPDC093546 TaxID=3366040 RepID=UPI003822F530
MPARRLPVTGDAYGATCRLRVVAVVQELTPDADGRDERTTVLAEPCPWCEGEPTGRTRSGGRAVRRLLDWTERQTPVELEKGRRARRAAELVALYEALQAAREG